MWSSEWSASRQELGPVEQSDLGPPQPRTTVPATSVVVKGLSGGRAVWVRDVLHAQPAGPGVYRVVGADGEEFLKATGVEVLPAAEAGRGLWIDDDPDIRALGRPGTELEVCEPGHRKSTGPALLRPATRGSQVGYEGLAELVANVITKLASIIAGSKFSPSTSMALPPRTC